MREVFVWTFSVHTVIQVILGLTLGQPREALMGIVALPCIIGACAVFALPLAWAFEKAGY